MKVWEAIDILRSLDPNAEVTITFGQVVKPLQNIPAPRPQWIPADPWKVTDYKPWHYTVTCETKH